MTLIKAFSVFLVISLISIVLFFFTTGGIFGECERVVQYEAKSPGNQFTASIVTKNCGATTPTATHVILNGPSGKDAPIFIVESDVGVRISWINAETLKVQANDRLIRKAFVKKPIFQGVNVVYEVVE